MIRFTRRGFCTPRPPRCCHAGDRRGRRLHSLTLGVLTPLTGAGSFDGPRMLKAMQAVADEINAAGGVLGRQIELVVEDDETNPEAAVRAAHKLIDVDKVPVIMGTWASAVTTAVAPVCWESKTFLTTVSGADSITHLPHQGYLIRTQPNNQLQATKHAEFIIRHGAKRVFILAIQAPFAEPTRQYLTDTLTPKGVDGRRLAGLRQGQDQLPVRGGPGAEDQARSAVPERLCAGCRGGAARPVSRRLRRHEIHPVLCADREDRCSELPKEVTQGVITVQPSADVNSPAYAAAAKRLGIAAPDSYEAQATDWISIVALTIAKAGQATGTAIRDTVRKITNSDGEMVYTAVDGLAALKAGQGHQVHRRQRPCTFTDIGDITDCKFRYNRVENGAFKFIEVA